MLETFKSVLKKSGEFQQGKAESPNLNEVQIVGDQGDSVPFYHLFLETNKAGIAQNTEIARSQASHYINNYPDLVIECSGKRKEEALQILAKSGEK